MLGLEGKGGSISRASESLAAAVVLAWRVVVEMTGAAVVLDLRGLGLRVVVVVGASSASSSS